jgi:DNA-binding MarR family transcriptional regulator/ribosomal protein S18 acetylase RimI-like enzyme
VRDVLIDHPHLFLGSRLKRLAEQLQSDAAQITQLAGIPIQSGQYPLLATLDAQGATTIGDLARSMRLSQPAITKTVGKLVESGLAAIDRSDADGRRRTVSLTAAGQAALDQSKQVVWPIVTAAVAQMTDDLSGSLFDQLGQLEQRLAIRSLATRAQHMAIDHLVPAADVDLREVAALMNAAYRGQDGWTNETAYIQGDRASEAMLRDDVAAHPQARLLLGRSLDGALQCCVWLEPLGDGVWYLGSLTIAPSAQNAGFGRRLLQADEDWAQAQGARTIKMTVVNVRDTLIAWYIRRGYQPTGETEPFPYDDVRFGTPLRPDLSFIALRKSLITTKPN